MVDGGTLKYYSGVKRKEVLTYTTQMNFQTPCQVKEASCKRSHIEWFYLYIMFTTGRAIDTDSVLVARAGGRGK